MHIDRFARFLAMSLVTVILLSALLCGCGGEDTLSDRSQTTSDREVSQSGTNASSVPVGYTTAHFPTFELSVPENWPVRGNVGKIYEGDGYFLLAGPFDPEGDKRTEALEQTLAEELELFFNTEYYRTQVRFQYDEQSLTGTLERVSGTLYNDRSGTTLRFAGGISTSPTAYFVYFWPDQTGDAAGTRYREVTYESFRVL